MRRKKLKPPKYSEDGLRGEYASTLKQNASQRTVLEGCLKLPSSPEAYSVVSETGCEFLEVQRKLDGMTAQVLFDYEQEIKQLRAENKKLDRKNKGLLIELRKSLKIKGGEKAKESNSDEADESFDSEKKRKRKKRGAPVGHRGGSRPVPENITGAEVVQPPEKCDCGCCQIIPLDDSDDKYVEDIMPVVRMVTKIRYLMGKCAGCGKVIRSQKGVAGPPVETGPNIGAYLTMLKQYGMTYGNLSKLCTDILDIPITRSGILGIVNRNIDRMNPIYDIIANHIPKEKILHGDESGWKVRGESGYIWIFCNKNVVYFLHDKSRAGAVPKVVLGEDYNGILICDFYGGYNFLKNTQRCLVHFLGDIKKQCDIYAGSKSLDKFKEQMKTFIKNGLEIQKLEESEEKQKEIGELGMELDAMAKIKLPKGDPEKLTKRILKYKDQMMLFVKHPGVEYHNNRAERHLRPMVIARKNSFGSDTDAGAKRMCVLQSVVETCKVNDIRPFEFINQVIRADPKIHNIITVPMLPI
jgi:hypothetical protein